MNNKITFIIPSLNRPTLERSVNSLIKQKNPNWECIIIYDGVDGPTFKDDRIRSIKIEKTGNIVNNIGQSGLVRNHGIKNVNTEWIGFLDDDDTLHPDYVNDLFKKYSNYDLVIMRMKDKLGNVFPRLSNTNIKFGNVGISICYKNKFGEILFDENKNGEDFEFVKKLTDLTENFIITPSVYYFVG